jgi:hypothetical protein
MHTDYGDLMLVARCPDRMAAAEFVSAGVLLTLQAPAKADEP